MCAYLTQDWRNSNREEKRKNKNLFHVLTMALNLLWKHTMQLSIYYNSHRPNELQHHHTVQGSQFNDSVEFIKCFKTAVVRSIFKVNCLTQSAFSFQGESCRPHRQACILKGEIFFPISVSCFHWKPCRSWILVHPWRRHKLLHAFIKAGQALYLGNPVYNSE